MYKMLNERIAIKTLFCFTLLFIGFGSVGANGFYNNLSIVYSFIYLFILTIIYFHKEIFYNLNTNNTLYICMMFLGFLVSCSLSNLKDDFYNWMRLFFIFASVVFGYFSYILLKEKVIGFKLINQMLALIGIGHVLILLKIWFSLPQPENFNWVNGLYFFNNIRHLTDFISICFLSSLILFSTSEKFWTKFFWILCSVIILSCIFWTGSRAAYIGLFFAIIYYVVFRKGFFKNISLVGSIVLVSMWLSTLFNVNNSSLGLFRSVTRSVGDSVNQVSSGRLNVYHTVFEWFTYHPIWGNGGEAVRQIGIYHGQQKLAQAHNSILQILVEFGIVGLISVILVLYRIYGDFKFSNLNINQNFSIVILINIAVSSFFNGGAYYVVTMSLFCLFLAVLYVENQKIRINNE